MNLSYLILIQLLLDIILIVLFLSVYIKLKTLTPQKIESFLRALKESQELTEKLNRLIEEKKVLVKELEAVLKPDIKNNNPKKSNNPTIQEEQITHSKVISLWKKGKTNKEIAKATGLTLGEIEVIISLFKSKQ